MRVRILIFAGLLAVLAGPASRCLGSAMVVNVDFNFGVSATYSGTAVAPDTGTFWNGVNGAGASALKASDGVTITGVSITQSNYSGHYSFGTPNLAPNLMQDYIYTQVGGQDPPSDFVIAGLTNSLNGRDVYYNLYLYSQNSQNGDSKTRFWIGNQTNTAVNAGNVGSFQQNVNYVLFSGLTANATGRIAGRWVEFPDVDLASSFNGFQLEQIVVPEPSSLVLGGTGALLLWRSRRRPRA